MTGPRFYSTRTVAEMLGISLRTVQLWVENGRLPAWKTDGGHRRIPAEIVDRMARAQRDSADTEIGTAFRVLLVEDDEHLMEIYRMALESLTPAVEIFEAHDGYDGLLQIGKYNPHLVILDLLMPGMDGFRLCRAVHAEQEFASTEIVVVTSLDKQAIADRGGVPPRIRIFPKPIPMSLLQSLVTTSRDVLRGAPMSR
ncbi:response regulator [Cupriavidus pinatubonensis]|uniref:Protein-glutamate methylesterase/protein-glutamine glutaminase n=1 Tax=Cupriavidus pinatubonensis TaxID=248026 RepID=A0ABM8WQY5_9BURK|nr:response regulator [Cupriavidus pinatubonensis]CAG9169835.1 Protein-glutamate methylesterase/protein-glutamine glutaminase [Cupriavidus pinatubonensis]